jgi:HSP20 family protein
MLMRTDPFHEIDRLSQILGNPGTATRPAAMPLDAWREGDLFIVELDLPGVDPSSIDVDVERNVLTVTAQRPTLGDHREMLAAERPRGIFSRQLVLGDSLDTDRVEASYEGGVLALHIPVAERAKPRRIDVAHGAGDRQVINA